MDRLTMAQTFITIVDRGSLTAAADALGVSRSMISRHLEDLETWLGARLLHRTTRRIGLTDAGERALPRLRAMLDLVAEVRSDAGRDNQEVQARLRIATSPSFAQSQLTAAVVAFQSRHPKVEVDLLVLERTVNLVEERVDLAVRLSNQLDPGMVARRLARCHSVLCAAPEYLRRHGTPSGPEDLAAHRHILHAGLSAPELVIGGKSYGGGAVPGILTGNETSVLRVATLAGAGIAMLPTYYVGDDLVAGRLHRVLPQCALASLDIQAVFLSRRHQSRPLRLLIEFLAERFGGAVAPWDAAIPGAREGVP